MTRCQTPSSHAKLIIDGVPRFVPVRAFTMTYSSEPDDNRSAGTFVPVWLVRTLPRPPQCCQLRGLFRHYVYRHGSTPPTVRNSNPPDLSHLPIHQFTPTMNELIDSS